MNLLPVGRRVEPYGKIAAVGSIEGERYYWFVEGNGVSMMPAFMIGELVEKEKKGTP